jgi:hypothetical protein
LRRLPRSVTELVRRAVDADGGEAAIGGEPQQRLAHAPGGAVDEKSGRLGHRARLATLIARNKPGI